MRTGICRQNEDPGESQSGARMGDVAAKGGADPAGNARLRLAIEYAKKVNMTKDTLERLIKKGAGLLDETVNYELVTFEGFGPHRVPVIVECLTDNRTRTASNVRQHLRGCLHLALSKCHGSPRSY